MIPDDLENMKCAPATEARRPRAHPSLTRRTVRLDRSKCPVQVAIEESLSSALLASDGELVQILQEVDKLSKSLRAAAAGEKALRTAQHPAVWDAVKQTLLERELRQLALTDDLTCLYNRRGFFAVASQLLKLAHRKVQTLLLFFCDVDNLKQINDSFGHQEGDLAIIRVADALEQTFRKADVLARIGGDEFVVMSLEASSRVEASLLRRLEKNLGKVAGGESRYKLSLSVGVARFDPRRPVSLGELMSQADRAMYEQKRARSSASDNPVRAHASQNQDTKIHLVCESQEVNPLKPCS